MKQEWRESRFSKPHSDTVRAQDPTCLRRGDPDSLIKVSTSSKDKVSLPELILGKPRNEVFRNCCGWESLESVKLHVERVE
jgi:hypothetical protein